MWGTKGCLGNLWRKTTTYAVVPCATGTPWNLPRGENHLSVAVVRSLPCACRNSEKDFSLGKNCAGTPSLSLSHTHKQCKAFLTGHHHRIPRMFGARNYEEDSCSLLPDPTRFRKARDDEKEDLLIPVQSDESQGSGSHRVHIDTTQSIPTLLGLHGKFKGFRHHSSASDSSVVHVSDGREMDVRVIPVIAPAGEDEAFPSSDISKLKPPDSILNKVSVLAEAENIHMPNKIKCHKEGKQKDLRARTRSKAKADGVSLTGERHSMFDDIISFSSGVDAPWLVGGDFNCIALPTEKKGETEDEPYTHKDGNDLEWCHEYPSVLLLCLAFTRSIPFSCNCLAFRYSAWGCDTYDDKFSGMAVKHLPRGPSDHARLLVSFGSSPTHPTWFTFQSMWSSYDTFSDTVKAAWDAPIGWHYNPFVILHLKLKAIRGTLHIWNKWTFGNINDNLLMYEEEARVKQESFDLNPSDENHTAMGEANANLRIAMNHMEIFSAQKARMQWLEDGDKNTAFYHAVVRGNRRRNTISRLQVDGVWKEDQESLKQSVVQFFMSLLQSSEHIIDETLLHVIPSIVSDAQNMELTTIPSREEIKAAVWSLNPSSALGPDGFTVSLYCLILILWEIWKGRCSARFESKWFSARVVINNIKFMVANSLAKMQFKDEPLSYELQVLNQFGFSPQVSPKCLKLVRWIPLIMGLCLNVVDGASKGNPGVCGGGGCIRDVHGSIRVAFAHFYEDGNNMITEIRSMCDGLQLADFLGETEEAVDTHEDGDDQE
ncbi:hypothetical protein Taro_044055 [Colocasia esculenta]|uniref:Uncharacterized protein n=1 Tax=Colocasia esculenta TaxID=4460 RepID=A0A843WKX2_COLES|nr:hypothetical protein [Colocasia esculenta]